MFDVYSNSRVVANGPVELTVTDHGSGDPVLMLHGFPDSARLWRHQIPPLVESGYRVIAPDMRGFGRSDRPLEVETYGMAKLAADSLGILDASEVETAHVVGHDWGAALAWYLAISAPQRLRSLTAVSVGHPSAFRAAGLRQLEKSWYMLLFQFEGVAERWLAQDDWTRFKNWSGHNPETDTWIADLSREGALTAALNVYRANMSPESLLAPRRELPPVPVPTMGIWSTRDFALTDRQMEGSGAHVAGEWRYEQIADVGHWIPLDAPEVLNPLLLDWLGGV